MHWILQNNLMGETQYNKIPRILDRFMIPYSTHDVVPFVGTITPGIDNDIKNVICMGSYSLRHTAKKYGWNPGVFDLEPFDFNVQLEYWGDQLLNYDSKVSKITEADFNKENMFIRPVDDSKSFAGTVMDKQKFTEWSNKIKNNPDLDFTIQLNSIKKIYAEYRFFIIKGKIITGSQYKMGGNVVYLSFTHIPNYILGYVHDILSIGWLPHDAFCLDVCESSGGYEDSRD